MTTKHDHIRIRVMLDEKTFTDFAKFNAFRLKKGMKQPILFCITMFAFSVISLFTHKPQSVITAVVLTIIGTSLPMYHIFRFNYSTRKSVRASGLPREAYELILGEQKVNIQSLAPGGNNVTLNWKEFHHAYRTQKCIYLYAMPQRAFLLPDGQAESASADEVWRWITQHIGKDKTTDVR